MGLESPFPERWNVTVHRLPTMRTKRASRGMTEHAARERFSAFRQQYPEHLTVLSFQREIEGRWTSDQVEETGRG